MIFTGSFSELEGCTILSGTFEVPRIIRAGLTCWVLCVIFLSGFALVSSNLAFLAVPALFLVFLIANLLLIRTWGQRDIEYVSDLINDTLS